MNEENWYIIIFMKSRHEIVIAKNENLVRVILVKSEAPKSIKLLWLKREKAVIVILMKSGVR